MNWQIDRRRLAPAVALVWLLMGAGGAWAQDDEPDRVPTIPNGVPAVLFPVQSTSPTAGGAWVGGAASDREAIELFNAELEFAFGEEEGAASWAVGEAVAYRISRNPMVKVNPNRLSYHGLLREPEPRAQIYEPLHTQLRQSAALFDARIVVLPLTLWYRPPTEQERLDAEASGAEPLGRAVLLTAIIDVRRSAVMWHGIIEGEPGEATSRSLLTTLAQRVASQLAPS